jgi:hypothetical protein
MAPHATHPDENHRRPGQCAEKTYRSMALQARPYYYALAGLGRVEQARQNTPKHGTSSRPAAR